MDVWVVYQDSGCYSDWTREIVGVYATLAAAQTGAAEHLMNSCPGTLEAWRQEAHNGTTATLERWCAEVAFAGPTPHPGEPTEYYAECWAVTE